MLLLAYCKPILPAALLFLLVLAYGCNLTEQCLFRHNLVVYERIMPGHWSASELCVALSALTFLVGWHEGHAAHKKNLCHLSSRFCFTARSRNSWRNRITQVHLENSHGNTGWLLHLHWIFTSSITRTIIISELSLKDVWQKTWNQRLRYDGSRPGMQSASLYDNFRKPGNYVIITSLMTS